MPNATTEDLTLAIALARTGGLVAAEHFSLEGVRSESKADGSPVTRADKLAEVAILEQLRAIEPQAFVVAEESSNTEAAPDRTPGRTWYIDPIDGTRAFAQGVPLFSCLIALNDAYGPCVGVIYLPILNELVAAGRGLGCTLNGKVTRVSAYTELTDAILTNNGMHCWPESAVTRFTQSPMTMRGWGDGYAAALVATGRAEAMVCFAGQPWDFAPLPIIMEEAGGRFTDLDGTLSISNGTALTSNGALHEEVLSLLRHCG